MRTVGVTRVLSRRSALGMFAGSCAAAGHALAAESPARNVVLQPLGPGSAALARFVSQALLAFYAVTIETAGVLALPKAAYYPVRGRYRAEKLLDRLESEHPSAFRVLGVTAVDISTTKGEIADWGILGLATIDGHACVLSSFRCRRRARNAAHATERLGKTAVHELGHTFGLEHCPNRGCLMEDGQGSVLTTDREFELCAECRAKVEARGLFRPGGSIPWRRPAG